MKSTNILMFAFFIVFIFLGIMALKEGMPEPKEDRIYNILKTYMPYTLEKRVGGYSIVSKETGVKEKPPSKELFKRLDQLEKMWGKEYLKIDGNHLVILDKNKKVLKRIEFHTDAEKRWVQNFFEIR